MSEDIQLSFERLYSYLNNLPLEKRFKGFDPFDGLSSPIISKTFLGRSRIFRLLWIQLFKRSPLNLRKITLVKSGYNPQALGLFLSAYCLLYKKHKRADDLASIEFLLKKIIASIIPGYSGACWGYNFNWQARAFYQPMNTPMIVPTSAVFNGLVDAYEILSRQELLNIALSVRHFIVQDLNRTYSGDNFAFSYSPLDNSVVYNASLMASKVLSRIYHLTSDEALLPLIDFSVKYCVSHQHDDGHWTYGTKPYHQWVDNFHTGYNLECLSEVSKYTETNQFRESLDRGFDYYITTFFDKEGRSKFYSNKVYPLDINNPAQLLSTVTSLDKVSEYDLLTNKVLKLTRKNMQHKDGWFYYRQYSYYTNKINYLRWSQAWMFFGMANFLYRSNE